jgi:PIN domain nuclease of toxin-antitoxin system
MKILLDTHIFLWFVSNDKRLPALTGDSIRDPANEVYLSVVSLWEIIVKYQLSKLPLPHPPEFYIPAQRRRHRIEDLALEETSVMQLAHLPSLHSDPFDRMMICQAWQHGMTLATIDPKIAKYPVPIL